MDDAGAIPTLMFTPDGRSMNGVAVLNLKLSSLSVPLMYTSTSAAAASALLWITCTLEVDVGKAIRFPPDGRATHNPKAAPSLLAAGFKNPEATTVSAAP